MDIPTLIKSVRRILRQPEIKVFVPALTTDVRSDSQTLHYMDGYLFVEFKQGVNYLRLRETTYFREVLCNRSRGPEPAYALLEDEKLDPMRRGMESVKENRFSPGDEVKVTSGTFKGLRCVVIDVDDEIVNVKMNYRSKPMILAYASTYLEHVEEK